MIKDDEGKKMVSFKLNKRTMNDINHLSKFLSDENNFKVSQADVIAIVINEAMKKDSVLHQKIFIKSIDMVNNI